MVGEKDISHPAVGFKSHLIRLIGNLCYKNKGNQDKVSLYIFFLAELWHLNMCMPDHDFTDESVLLIST